MTRRWSLFPKRLRRAIGSPAYPDPSSGRGLLPPDAAPAFAEAVLWCSRQELAATSDDPEYLRNKTLVEHRGFENVSFDSLSPLSSQLRSSVLQPSIEIGETWVESERDAAVTRLIALRSQLLSAEGALDRETVLSDKNGRILLYEPAENVSDGASQVASLGFFDVNDAPPWDTWIHYSNGKLSCWVPHSLISLAQNGIDANPVQCIQWAPE